MLGDSRPETKPSRRRMMLLAGGAVAAAVAGVGGLLIIWSTGPLPAPPISNANPVALAPTTYLPDAPPPEPPVPAGSSTGPLPPVLQETLAPPAPAPALARVLAAPAQVGARPPMPVTRVVVLPMRVAELTPPSPVPATKPMMQMLLKPVVATALPSPVLDQKALLAGRSISPALPKAEPSQEIVQSPPIAATKPTATVVPPSPVPAPKAAQATVPTPAASSPVPEAVVPAPHPISPPKNPEPARQVTAPTPDVRVAIVVPPLAASPASPPHPTQAALRAAIQEATAPLGCALIGGDFGTSGEAAIAGVVSHDSAPILRQMMRDAIQGSPAQVEVAAFDGPYCHTIDILHGIARPFAGGGSDLGLALKDARTTLARNDYIVPRLRMPEFPAYLTLDYFVSDGSVAHLRFGADPTTPLPPLAEVSVGDPSPAPGDTNLRATGMAGWQVDAPYGTDLIVAIASDHPLFNTPRPDSETPEAYLGDLRTALGAAARRGGRVIGRAMMVTTVER